MSLFANMKRKDDIEAPKDTLGGGSYTRPSDIYLAVVKVAHAFTTDKGAQGITVEFQLQDESTYKETFYVSNRNGQNFSEKNGKTFYMQGFVTVDELCALATEKYLADQETADKLIKVYDYDAGGETEKEMPVLVELTGKKVYLAIQEVKQFKKVKQADNSWVETEETQNVNQISKVFNQDKFTVNELMDQADEPEFFDKWKEKYEGEVYDKTKGKKPKGAKGSGVGSPKKPGEKKSLFGNR